MMSWTWASSSRTCPETPTRSLIPTSTRWRLSTNRPDERLIEPDKPPGHLNAPSGTSRGGARKIRVTATTRRDISAKVGMLLLVPGKIWEARDPWCGGAFVTQLPATRDALADIICDSADLVAWFTGPAGGFMKYLSLATALQPVGIMVWAHHVAHSVGSQDGQAPQPDMARYAACGRPWKGRVWMNPPYSEVGKWMAKAAAEVAIGNADLVVCLVPARVDARWYRAAAAVASVVRILPQRVKFGGLSDSAPFPSAVIVLGTDGRRHGAEPKRCGACGRYWFPARNDARTCSAACRKRSSRSQITALKRDA